MTRRSAHRPPPPPSSGPGDATPRAPTPRIDWPDGKPFAFTVVDDTDHSTLENAPPVYALLAELGLRTTKSVWTIGGDPRDGLACDDARYRAWVERLHEQGFEIALHNVAPRT